MNIWEIAALSMTNDLHRMSSVSHNIANGTTVAFKREYAVDRTFSTYLGVNPVNSLALKVNVPVIEKVTDYTVGSLKFTGNPLDFAVTGPNTYFELDGGTGPLFTRQGSFRTDTQGRLISESGYRVVGSGGDIVLNGDGNVTVDEQGKILEGGRFAGQFKLVKASDPSKLEQLGAGLFRSINSEAVQDDRSNNIRQGYLEASNVNTMAEMVKMISIVRQFEFSQKILQGYDGMMDKTIRSLGEF